MGLWVSSNEGNDILNNKTEHPLNTGLVEADIIIIIYRRLDYRFNHYQVQQVTSIIKTPQPGTIKIIK